MTSMLAIDIDAIGLDALIGRFDLPEEQIRFAISRALRRTGATIRVQSATVLRKALGLARTTTLRRRIRVGRRAGVGRGLDRMTVWYGENDFPTGDFKGRAVQTESGVEFAGHTFNDAFIGVLGGKRRILERVGAERTPIRQVTMPVKDQMDVTLEDEVFAEVPTIFMHYLEAELRARAVFGVGAAK